MDEDASRAIEEALLAGAWHLPRTEESTARARSLLGAKPILERDCGARDQAFVHLIREDPRARCLALFSDEDPVVRAYPDPAP
jgi:hypothetical protein